MLFEFHRQQNGKKPGTVHATYLVAGTKYVDNTNPHTEKDGEDEHMRSSPFRSSPLQPSQEAVEDTPILFLTLVGEDELESTPGNYMIIDVQTYFLYRSSIAVRNNYIYSRLQPWATSIEGEIAPFRTESWRNSHRQDLQIVSDANREIVDKYSDQDPLEVAALYGAIINKEVRRRKGRRPPPPSSQIAVLPKAPIPKSKIAEVKEESRVPTSSISSSTNTDSKSSQSSAAKDFFGKGTAKKETPTGSGDRRTPAPKRDPSNIFKSFAKAKPKLQREGTDSSAAASIVESPAPSGPEDEPMRDVSDDEEDEYIVPEPASKQVTETDRKSRKEREQALKKMMEDADEEELTTPAEIEESEPEPEISKDSPAGQPSEVVEISGGRRRGRRRVMKKKTFRDEEGYLGILLL